MRGIAFSDFNLGTLANFAASADKASRFTLDLQPFVELPSICERASTSGHDRYDVALVWTRPQAVIESFQRVLDFAPVPADALRQEVDDYCANLSQLKRIAANVFVVSWTLPPDDRGWGPLLEMNPEVGMESRLVRMNALLAERLSGQPGFYCLSAQRWIGQNGAEAFSAKHWYLSKSPFSSGVYRSAIADIRAAMTAVRGGARKLLVLDLDNTLWGGVVGDDGLAGLRLGGHDAVGEAFVDFQREIRALKNKGVLLAIASKNEHDVVLDAFARHPELVLKIDDFAATRINWSDKAANIAEMAAELNLGLDSVVFIDDNPAERDRVRSEFPDVLVPEWPDNPLFFAQSLRGLSCFDKAELSQEDAQRTQYYQQDSVRKRSRETVSSYREWLDTLDMAVRVEAPGEVNLPRIVQLLNKTNQMNLQTRRVTDGELSDWLQADGHRLWAFRLSDKFGDSGLVGIVSVDASADGVELVDFVLSCRAFGREIEELMLATVVEYARSRQLPAVHATYRETPKNKPCLTFFEHSGLERSADGRRFTWQTDKARPRPAHIRVVDEGATGAEPLPASASDGA